MTGILALPATLRTSIPSPTQGVWHLGPVPLRAYALCILAGIMVAIWLGERRWVARGGRPGAVGDIAIWAVPMGVLGGRIYHVITSPDAYFGADGHLIDAVKIWEGGLGIWGAVTLGGVGAWIGCRRAGILLPPMADALAPGVVLAQAIGRWGNWFNNELYGGKTDLPWGLTIHQWDLSAGRAVLDPAGNPVVLGTFHPAFLYESLWDVGVFLLLLWVDRRYRIGHGRIFALYVLAYTLGRGWIEALRTDPASHVLGLRINLWTSLLVGVGALVYLLVSARLRPGREESLDRPGADRGPEPAAGEQEASEDEASADEASEQDQEQGSEERVRSD